MTARKFSTYKTTIINTIWDGDEKNRERVANLLPSLIKPAKAVTRDTFALGKAKRKVCPDCGVHSTKQLDDGRCHDALACSKRRDKWE